MLAMQGFLRRWCSHLPGCRNPQIRGALGAIVNDSGRALQRTQTVLAMTLGDIKRIGLLIGRWSPVEQCLARSVTRQNIEPSCGSNVRRHRGS